MNQTPPAPDEDDDQGPEEDDQDEGPGSAFTLAS